MPRIIVRKESNELLFDTDKITYGLVKSGNMELNRNDGYYTIRGINVDPNEKSSYNYNANKFPVHGFTVNNCFSPIVFIVGRGCLIGSARSGNSVTFYYASATTDTKYYCFDLMRDTSGSGPYIKTFLDTGLCTFNSLMPPLNVAASVQAPGPGPLYNNGYHQSPYPSGTFTRISTAGSSSSTGANLIYTSEVSVGAGEYAAYLPWSRVAGMTDTGAFGNGATYSYGVVEGAFGGSGKVTFMFGATTEGTFMAFNGSPNYVPAMYINLPIDRFPVALLIRTENLPFPYAIGQ